MGDDPTLPTDAEIADLERRLTGDDPIEMPKESLDTIVKMIKEWRHTQQLQKHVSALYELSISEDIDPETVKRHLQQISKGPPVPGAGPTSKWTDFKASAGCGVLIGGVLGIPAALLIFDTAKADDYFIFTIPLGAVIGIPLTYGLWKLFGFFFPTFLGRTRNPAP